MELKSATTNVIKNLRLIFCLGVFSSACLAERHTSSLLSKWVLLRDATFQYLVIVFILSTEAIWFGIPCSSLLVLSLASASSSISNKDNLPNYWCGSLLYM